MNCLICDKETTNPKYCSRSCAAIASNKKTQKRFPTERFCKKCGTLIPITRNSSSGKILRRLLCFSCNKNNVDWKLVTKETSQNLRSYQISSRIRNLGRYKYLKSSLPKECFICGYNKHIEIHHKISIDSFPDSATIEEINSFSNLVALCPTHHWEADNNILKF